MKNKIPNRKQYRKADISLEELKRRIDALDLDCIKMPSGFRISDEVTEYVARKYRHFLFLCGSTGEIIVPTIEVDAFWHEHIVDTLKYAEDCQHVFGFYLHHFPYFGDQDDDAEFKAAYGRSKQLYEAQFGEAYGFQEAIKLDSALAKRLRNDGANCG